MAALKGATAATARAEWSLASTAVAAAPPPRVISARRALAACLGLAGACGRARATETALQASLARPAPPSRRRRLVRRGLLPRRAAQRARYARQASTPGCRAVLFVLITSLNPPGPLRPPLSPLSFTAPPRSTSRGPPTLLPPSTSLAGLWLTALRARRPAGTSAARLAAAPASACSWGRLLRLAGSAGVPRLRDSRTRGCTAWCLAWTLPAAARRCCLTLPPAARCTCPGSRWCSPSLRVRCP